MYVAIRKKLYSACYSCNRKLIASRWGWPSDLMSNDRLCIWILYCEKCNIAEGQNKDFKTAIIDMIKETLKCTRAHIHCESYENTNGGMQWSRNRINKENPNWGKAGNESIRNLNKNLSGKPHQQNPRDGRKNLRHWRQN